MYIRSQCGFTLGRFDVIQAEHDEQGVEILGYSGEHDYWLGHYPEERARKVIEDIQAHIVNYDRFVYNMPKE